MCLGQTLERIHQSGNIDVFPKLLMVREPTTDDYKSQGTQMNKWYEFDGMESDGRRELRHRPLSNMRYSAMLYNVEGLKQDVNEPVLVLGMTDMQSQYNWGMVDSGFNFLWKRA